MGNSTGTGGSASWIISHKEAILFLLGVGVIVYTIAVMPWLNQPFHPEYLLAGVALCGVSITSLGDRKK